MANAPDTLFTGANLAFLEGLYGRYLKDPSAVDPSWRELFERQVPGAGLARSLPRQLVGLQARVDSAIDAFRLRGHLVAELDPLGRAHTPPGSAADLGVPDTRLFSAFELAQEVEADGVFPGRRARLADLLAHLRRTYCGHVAVEFEHLLGRERRVWLARRLEDGPALADEERQAVLDALTAAEAFEGFLHTRYVGAKRFSLDGAESLIPMLHTLLETGSRLGLEEVLLGMAHRGRLTVLVNVLGKPAAEVFREFEGPADPREYLSRGDVKYHQGFSSKYRTRAGKPLALSLTSNPSHLEAVDPVVEGQARARQERLGAQGPHRVLPLLIHGDAAFVAQGVVAEVLNLSGLPGYRTGGTIHLVINNQLGFTTEPAAARSSRYCTALAQMLDIPVFHVNGDDPEACARVTRLATEYRQRFLSDVVVDLVCFRRHGHNEGDEPTFTQPEMYALIQAHLTVRQRYAEALEQLGLVPAARAQELRRQHTGKLQEAQAQARGGGPLGERTPTGGLWQDYTGGRERDALEVDTGVERAKLAELLRQSTRVPEGFHVHPKVARLLGARREMAEGQRPLDWSTGEALALASLLAEGHSVRLTGQDTERGTFSQRHAVLHDVQTGQRYVPLAHLAQGQGTFTVLNSPLSELGCLGFEYGYSLERPDSLVAWEAQFGDFANAAQVVIDQFLAAGERKWGRLSGLTLLLPHGYEGQGPEHSSARLERFLALCAEDNLQVCYPTTPAQLFHLLRRQVVRPYRKPLVVMTPKSLLRKSETFSTLDELAAGRFQRVLFDGPEVEPATVTRLLLCSGKVFYDLQEARQRRWDSEVALWRVEQLYPFPVEELSRALAGMPSLSEVVWVQEEPRNMGAWRHLLAPLAEVAGAAPARPRLRFTGRAESASPATGYFATHVLEQEQLVAQALSREGEPAPAEARH